jgi:hypothetical protein
VSKNVALVLRLLTSLFALAFLVNGGYEYMIMGHTADASLSLSLCALLISWYLDLRKQDRRI